MKKLLILFIYLLITGYSSLSQNVGIGTVTPAEKLHVAGNIKADTVKPNAIKLAPNAGTGKILTSDAAGNANWQSNNASAGGVGFGTWGDCSRYGSISEYNPIADTAASVNDQFGKCVSISGNFAIVGIASDDVGTNVDQGSANIYQHNGTNWVFTQKLTETSGAASDLFGIHVNISGNYAVVGIPLDDIGAATDQGSANVYQYNGSSWVFMQKIIDATGAAGDFFGFSVAVSGNKIIVSSPADYIGSYQLGSVSIYQLIGGSWVLMQKIIDDTGMVGDGFGSCVSISGNYAMVGSPEDDMGSNIDQGSASIYKWNGSSWLLMQKISDPAGLANERFGGAAGAGNSLSISGNYAIVGTNLKKIGPNLNQGTANIFNWNGSNWVLIKTITDTSNAYAFERFGFSVCLSENYAIIGSWGHYVGSVMQGSATIYQRIGNGWGKLQYMIDPLLEALDGFGQAVSIDGITKRFLIGAPSYANYSGKVIFGKIN